MTGRGGRRDTETGLERGDHQSAERVDGYLINPAGLTSEGFAVPHALLETHRPFMEMHFSNVEANPDTPRGAPVGPLKSWFSPFATGKMTGMRQYGYIGALVALTLPSTTRNSSEPRRRPRPMDNERQSLVDMLRRLGRGQAADEAAREMPERFSRKQLDDFARRHGILSRDELTDLMGGSP